MTEKDKAKLVSTEKRKAADQEAEPLKDLKKVISRECGKKCARKLIAFEIKSFSLRQN